MNKQRKVLITITYNEMGIIIDTKAEEVTQQNLQQTCNQLATDCISRQAAIEILYNFAGCIVDTPNGDYRKAYEASRYELETLPSAQPEIAENL